AATPAATGHRANADRPTTVPDAQVLGRAADPGHDGRLRGDVPAGRRGCRRVQADHARRGDHCPDDGGGAGRHRGGRLRVPDRGKAGVTRLARSNIDRVRGHAMDGVEPVMVTTGFDLPGYRVVRSLGLVRGIVVRSRSIFGNIGAAFQSLFGGNITLYTNLCEKARSHAFPLMHEPAAQRGANAIIGMRYDANEVAAGITEVLAYGTAVVIERG